MPGGRPSKPLALVKGHRTKAEKAVREKGESELITGTTLKIWPEVDADPIAKKEFKRIKSLFQAINKNDDLYSAALNTHCLLKGEISQFDKMQGNIGRQMAELEKMHGDQAIETIVYLQERGKLQDRYMVCDRKIMEKRKMMLDISKENIMTIQGALRSIPKKPAKPEANSPMAEYLHKKRQPK